MSALAILLIAISAADLCRRDGLPRWLPLPAGLLAVLLLGILAGQRSVAEVLLLVLVAVITVIWVVLVSRSRLYGTDELPPLFTLLGGAVLLFLLGGLAGPVDGPIAGWLAGSGWPRLAAVDPDRFLLLVGLFTVQLSTGNELVRQVLAAVDAIKPSGQPQASDRLRGGRLLGPMERLFILGLGLAGQVTAAGLVIAAKGLIRFPELNARRADNQEVAGIGIDEVTEYFLLGSFVSWLVSLTALGLAFLG